MDDLDVAADVATGRGARASATDVAPPEVMVQLAPEPEAMSFIERYLGSMQFRTYLGTIEEFSRELWSRWTERRETAQLSYRCRRIRAT